VLLLLLASSHISAPPLGAAAKRTDRSSEAATAPSYAQYLNYTATQLAAATSNKARTPHDRMLCLRLRLCAVVLTLRCLLLRVLLRTGISARNSASTWSRRLRRPSPRRR
jgi:hypothetical protein